MGWLDPKELFASAGKGAAGEAGKIVGGAVVTVAVTAFPPVRDFLTSQLQTNWWTLLLVLGSWWSGVLVAYLLMRRRINRFARDAAIDFRLGIYNDRECERRMDQVVRLYARDPSYKCAFVLLDLDWFKPFNDKEGYSAGDKVLQQFVDLVRAATRESDVLCRFRSGDEFLLLLPQATVATGFAVADRIRDLTQRYDFLQKARQGNFSITVSAGVAGIDEGMEDASRPAPKVDPQVLLQTIKDRLHARLKAAKAQRNNVVMSSSAAEGLEPIKE